MLTARIRHHAALRHGGRWPRAFPAFATAGRAERAVPTAPQRLAADTIAEQTITAHVLLRAEAIYEHQ
eukprot:SAG22_NODE_17_length_32684_cov_34.234095_4_plen_68_part_00